MFYRKDAVFMTVVGILASAGYATAADTAVKTPLTLDTVVVDNAPPSGLLMQGFDKVGVGDPLKRAGLNIYGWIEAGYTYSHRHHDTDYILPGPFNHEAGGGYGNDNNHFMLNQVTLRFEKLVKADPTKWDIGGMVEVMYGTDAGVVHSNGMEFQDKDNDPYVPEYQFDLTQAYIDLAVPVGNGLKVRVGKQVTHMGYETIDPRGNPFYSHSYLLSDLPFTMTGVFAYYALNDQWAVMGGISRGWDQSTEDNNGCSIDAVGKVIFTPSKQLQFTLNWTTGPENDNDSSHYRTAIDGIAVWQATEQLKLGLEVLYIYDGGWNAYTVPPTEFTPGYRVTHAYGDRWGAAIYAAYTINEFVTANARLEKAHYDADFTTLNVYDITLGVTVRPFPKNEIGKNLVVRPEIRYSYSEDHIYFEGNGAYKDQLTFACDVIFGF